MNKTYILWLSAQDHRALRELVKQLNGWSQKMRQAQM
jgi:hypothetical protein